MRVRDFNVFGLVGCVMMLPDGIRTGLSLELH